MGPSGSEHEVEAASFHLCGMMTWNFRWSLTMDPPEIYSIISFSSEKLQGHSREGSSSSANTLRSRVESFSSCCNRDFYHYLKGVEFYQILNFTHISSIRLNILNHHLILQNESSLSLGCPRWYLPSSILFMPKSQLAAIIGQVIALIMDMSMLPLVVK
jgi:hypothetical protein